MVDTLFFGDAEAFREWLEAQQRQVPEVWVLFHKKGSGNVSQTWSEAVDVALCFGWIEFLVFPPSYRRDSVWWVMSAKREETRLKRLEVLISSSLHGQRVPALRARGARMA